jgi:CheY-like chemotaxis protein
MSKLGPIVIVDDDPDDHYLIREICHLLKLQNEIVSIHDGHAALEYLRTPSAIQPFIILCDMNMPGMTGLQLRDEIIRDEALRKKSIPFVFLSTTAREKDVKTAYDLTVQGYFEKGHDFEKFKEKLVLIFEYWRECKHPNTFKDAK